MKFFADPWMVEAHGGGVFSITGTARPYDERLIVLKCPEGWKAISGMRGRPSLETLVRIEPEDAQAALDAAYIDSLRRVALEE